MDSNKEKFCFKVGDTVRIHGSSVIGVIIGVNEKKNILEIESQGKVIKVSREKISYYSKNTSITIKNRQVPTRRSDKNLSIDLHGLVKQEALDKTLNLINRAILENCISIEIIHGHGEGVLRKAVHKLLKENTNIEYFCLKENNTGTTIAYLSS